MKLPNSEESSKNLIEEIGDGIIKKLFENGETIQLESGDYLFRQGDRESYMCIVLKGRLRAIKEKEDSSAKLGDIGAGEIVGEIAFFTSEVRMASVRAIRKSSVLKVDKEIYISLVSQNPTLASSMVKLVIDRLRRNEFQKNKSLPPKNIAVLNMSPNLDINSWTNKVEHYFKGQGQNLNILCKPENLDIDIDNYIDSLEDHVGINILLCDEQHMEWSQQCLVYSDLIIIAFDFEADKTLTTIEKTFGLHNKSILSKKIYLLLFHTNHNKRPIGTSDWLRQRPVDMHIHIRIDKQEDTNRFCRIISHQAVGLVLGGGGAKGFAHIGVVQALREKGIEIDFLGGTSSGALYGIGMCFLDFQFKKIHNFNEEGVRRKLTSNDFALPLISMMAFKKFKRFLKELYGEHHLEDLWVKSFCISTNYTKAQLYVHETGLLWKQISASMAIPGVYPPVVIDKNLHVDGGVMDNLPIDPMFRYPVGSIIAVSLSSNPSREVDYKEVPSSLRIFWDKFRRKKRYKIPGLSSIVINSLSINSAQRQEEKKRQASHYIELDLKGIGMLDDSKWKETIDRGYKQTLAYFNNVTV